MPTVPVLDAKGKKGATVELNADVFGVEIRVPLLHQAVTRELADRRAGTHASRGRSDVSGGGRKPWKQKGTGRARQGSIRATQWKGGGKPFGPKPRSYAQDLPRAMRREALRAAVAARVADGGFSVIESLDVADGKTKSLVTKLEALGLKTVPPATRALGASHIGEIDSAKKELHQLESLRESLIKANEKYWADQVDIQGEIAAAWLTLAEGKQQEALSQMRHAVDHEDSTDKHPVTPGVILPARELLGEMLLELKKPAEALVEFEGTLRTAPNRYNALSGAARAAKLSGDSEKAKSYYAKLLVICDHADGDRPELQDARALLAQK